MRGLQFSRTPERRHRWQFSEENCKGGVLMGLWRVWLKILALREWEFEELALRNGCFQSTCTDHITLERTTVVDLGLTCVYWVSFVSKKMEEVALDWLHLSHVLSRLELKLWCGRGLQFYVLWTVRLALSQRSSQKTPCTYLMGAIVQTSQMVIIKSSIEILQFLASTSKIKIYHLAHWSLGQVNKGRHL